MSVPILSPVVRIDLAQLVIKNIFETALAPLMINEIVWGVTDESRPPRPYGMMDWLSGPSQLNAIATETVTILTQSKYFLDIPASPVADDQYVLRLNTHPHIYVVQSGDTSEAIRDSFIASINADLEPATASIVSATRILVETSVPAGLWSFDAALPLVGTVDGSGLAQHAKLHSQRNDATISLTVYTEDAKISTGAMQVAARIGIIPDLVATLDTLERYGFSLIQVAEPVNDTALTSGGAKYEGIATMDYQFGIPSNFPEPIDTIESVVTSITIGTRVIPLAVPA